MKINQSKYIILIIKHSIQTINKYIIKVPVVWVLMYRMLIKKLLQM